MRASTVDSEFLYSSLASDPDLGEIVDLFVEEMPQRVEALTDTLARGDWSELRRYAHQMKGACGSYGFDQLTRPACRVEAACRDDQDEQLIREAVEELVALCQKVRSGSGD
jgi:histidine phosphotransfer protein HptB